MMRMAMVTTTDTTMETTTDTTTVKLLDQRETLLSSSALILMKTLQIVISISQAVRKSLTPSQLLTWLVVSLKIACLLGRTPMGTSSCFLNPTTILLLIFRIMIFPFQPWIKLKRALFMVISIII